MSAPPHVISLSSYSVIALPPFFIQHAVKIYLFVQSYCVFAFVMRVFVSACKSEGFPRLELAPLCICLEETV